MSTGVPAAAIDAPRFRALTSVRATGAAGVVSAIVVVAATFVAVFGPLLAPYDPELPNLDLAWIGPTGGHLLGFDVHGRDVLSRLLAGAQTSMLGPLVVVIISMITGVLLAIVAAWRRGAADAVISSGLDTLTRLTGRNFGSTRLVARHPPGLLDTAAIPPGPDQATRPGARPDLTHQAGADPFILTFRRLRVVHPRPVVRRGCR